MIKFIKRLISEYKWRKRQATSGCYVLEVDANGASVIGREDGVIFKKGDMVLFTNYKGEKLGPWEISGFNIYAPYPNEARHCSARFKHTTTNVLSIGLLEHI